MAVYFMWGNRAIPSFVKCLESLPNLHTLEIGRTKSAITAPLKDALKRVKLPQIKTLILPPTAYPLLQRCHEVEDVTCVTSDSTMFSDEFLGALSSNQDSKVRRLAIPLVSRGDQSRKWSSPLYDHRVRMVTDCLQPQDTWPHFQDSPNSP